MARYDEDEFIRGLGLDPKDWHTSGEPSVVPDKNGVSVDPNDLVRPGKNQQTGAVTPAAGRDSVDWQINLVGPNGEVRKVTMRPQGAGVNAANVGTNQLDWNTTGIEQTIRPDTTGGGVSPAAATSKAQADADQARAAADEAKARQAALESAEKERQKNLTSRNLLMTDKEIADMDATLRSQGLTQQQIDNQLKIASDNNKNAQTSNDIALVNAKTTAFVAQKNADIADARLGLDTNTQATDADLRKAQQTALAAQNDIVNAQNQQRIDIEKLNQQQTNLTAQGTLGVNQQNAATSAASAVETARHNVAQENAAQAAAQQTAEQAALQAGATAAGTLYSTERSAQQSAAATGANILKSRGELFQNLSQAPFTQAAQLSQGSAGRYGMLGGGIHHPLPGGAVENIIMGAYGTSAAMMGGQSTLDAAMQAVEAIRPGAALTPQGQAAASVLSQMMDHTNAILGKLRAPATAGAAAGGAPTAQAAGAAAGPPQSVVIAPQTTTLAPPAPVMLSSGTEGVGNPWAGGATPPPGTVWQNPAYIQAPQTVAPPRPTMVVTG